MARLTHSLYTTKIARIRGYITKFYNLIWHTVSVYIKCWTYNIQQVGGDGGGGYAESRWTLNRWVFCLLRECAVLTSAGSSFSHCHAKIEKSCDLWSTSIFTLNDGGTRPAEVVEHWSCGVWCDQHLEVGRGSTIDCGYMVGSDRLKID